MEAVARERAPRRRAGPRRGRAGADGHSGQSRAPRKGPAARSGSASPPGRRSTPTWATRRWPATASCELKKVRCAIRYGADTVMDLSTGDGDRRHPPADHRRGQRAGRHGAHLPDGRAARRHRRHAAAGLPRRGRAAGRAGRRLHDGPLRAAARAPAAGGEASDGHRQPGRLAGGQVDGRPRPARTRSTRTSTSCARSCGRTTSPGAWATGCGPGSIADASDEAQFAELAGDGRAGRAGVGAGLPGDDRGAGPRAHGPDRDERPPAEGVVPRGAVLRARSAGDRRGAGLRPHHQRDRRGDGGVVRGGDALLRDAQGAPGAAEPGGRPPGGDRLQDRRPRGRRGPAPPRRAGPRRRPVAGPLRLRLGRAVPAGAGPRDRPADARGVAAGGRWPDARLLHACAGRSSAR